MKENFNCADFVKNRTQLEKVVIYIQQRKGKTTERDVMYYYLTSQEATALKKRSIENGWNPLPIQGANNRAYYRVNGDFIELKSYDTIVFDYNVTTGEFNRRWGGYSATTLKHVQMFWCYVTDEQYQKNTTFGKKNWESMKVA